MNELQRQQYLDALGIESYMPRSILPLAPEPVRCEASLPAANSDQATQVSESARTLPVSESAQRLSVESVASVPAPNAVVAPAVAPAMPSESGTQLTTGASAAAAVLASMAPEPVVSAAPKQAEANTSEQQDKETDPVFALSLWRVSEDLLIIDSRHAELALPTEPLLRNILVALGLPANALPKAEVLRWPMYENAYAQQGEAAAREAMSAMLEVMLEAAPVKFLLLMGQEASHFILPLQEDGMDRSSASASYDSSLGKVLSIPSFAAQAIVVPSLSQLLQQPELKRIAWQSIQPLRQR